MKLLGVDTGGTFTDFVLWDDGAITTHKVLSTPAAPEQAILLGIADLKLLSAVSAGAVAIVHGSTVATNAALEGKGVRTVFITNAGFKDLLTIGRQARPQLYNLQPPAVVPPVVSELCVEVNCRVDAHGQCSTDLSAEEIACALQQVQSLKPQAVAINFLFSYLNDVHEKALETMLADDFFVSRSSFVLPEYKEYERGVATWLNAYLGPLVNRYLKNLQQATAPSPLAIMQSSGGTIDATQASQRAVNLLLSGPAGGLAAAKKISELTRTNKLMTFDMGGTSTDVALIQGELRVTNEGKLGPYPIAVPMVDMHTIGAGGGSIAYLDAGGLLQVGPQSAGADPGPACYGRGGTQATVTDANAVLGRIPAQTKLAGNLAIDADAAHKAVAQIAKSLQLSVPETALGIVRIANEHMARALRVISVQRGFDPQDFYLCSFGGAGGLHVCDLAEQLHMHKAMVPRFAGVLSAFGMLVAPRERQLSHTLQTLLAQTSPREITDALQQLAERGKNELLAEGAALEKIQFQASVDLRYAGQSYALNIAFENIDQCSAQFHRQHELLYGHRLQRAIELVTLRQRVFCPPLTIDLPFITAEALSDSEFSTDLFGIGGTRVLPRDALAPQQILSGPLLITETVATTFIKPGWQVAADNWGNLVLEKK